MENLPNGGLTNCLQILTSHLLDYLNTKHIFIVGTVRVDKMEKGNLKLVETLCEETRGSHDYSFDGKYGMLMLRWQDTVIISFCGPNFFCIKPLCQIKHWSIPQTKHNFHHYSNISPIWLHNTIDSWVEQIIWIKTLEKQHSLQEFVVDFLCLAVDVVVQKCLAIISFYRGGWHKPYTLGQFHPEVAMTYI